MSLEWIKDSVDKGYCQDENNYVIEGGETAGTTSTPEGKKGILWIFYLSLILLFTAPKFVR